MAERRCVMADHSSLTKAQLETLSKLYHSATGCDRDVMICERCGNPIFMDDSHISTTEVIGCWYAATLQEKHRAPWCLDRQFMFAHMDDMPEPYRVERDYTTP